MKKHLILKIIVAGLFLLPLVPFQGCKKQPKCGCGKDVIHSLNDIPVTMYQITSGSIMFTTMLSPGSMYYFCNPSQWYDSLQKLNTSSSLLLSGKAYYDCTYLMQTSNSSYYSYPVFQVDVTGIKEDNYGK